MSWESRRWASMAAAAALAVLLATPVASAQESGAVGGTVTDTTGLVLPGVTVDARSADSDGVHSTTTDGGGAFAFADLPAGTYDLTFTLPGFRTAIRDGVVVGAGIAVTLDVELALALEERVVVVGSRAEPRSVTESPVPIDAVSFQDVVSQGATTLDYQLRTLIPSFNVATHPISDAATLVRPASLRNLAHDHTLVLVNGKRRHRSSVIAWFAGVTDGAQGPDISTIPAIALRQGGGAARRGVGPVRLRRHRRRDELPAEGRPGGREHRGQHRDLPGGGRRHRDLRRQRRPAARLDRLRQPQPGVRQLQPHQPQRAARRRGGPHRRG